MKQILKELLKPQGIYSTRRLIALVSAALVISVTVAYIITPHRYSNMETIITVLSGLASASVATVAFKKHDQNTINH